MTREVLTHGWSVRRRATAFQELGNAGADDWAEVLVPHDAVVGLERDPDLARGETTAYFPGGAFEYRRTLPAPETMAGQVVELEFDGVYRDAMVYVNGALAGQHAYGYSRFTVRIDPFLRFGTDNEIRVACRTHQDSRWYAGAGLHRDVTLVVKDPVRVARDGIRITTCDVDTDRAVVEVAVTVENDSLSTTTVALEAVVEDPQGHEAARGTAPVTVLPGTTATARHRLVVDSPALWDVDSPALHTAHLRLRHGDRLLDEESTTFGIRTLQLDARHGLRINGRTVKLRGTCLHADNGPLGAVSLPRAEERRIAMLKKAGFNAIRSSHHPASAALLDACDRIGMLVMDETFDMWTTGKSDFDYAFEFPQWWERDVEALVARAFNHPSVIMYSIGNEIPETGDRFGAVWSRRLAEKVRSLDSTRFVTNGINGFVATLDTVLPMLRAQRGAAAEQTPAEGGVNTMMDAWGALLARIQSSPQTTAATEESFAVLDVAGMNYAEARYELDRELFPDRVIVGTETYPTVIAANWTLVTRNDHVIGDFTWTGWDYLGETGIGRVHYAGAEAGRSGFSGGYPELTAFTGDFDITGHRRPASYYREIVYGLRQEPYIAVLRPEFHGREVAVATQWAWSDAISSWTWEGFEGRPVAVEVYADADEVELLLDGVVLGRAKVGTKREYRADFEVTYQPGVLIAVAYAGGVKTGRTSLTTAGDALVLVADADRTELVADGRDLAYLTLRLTDGRGNVHPGRDRRVEVTVDGPAVLAGIASGNPSTDEPLTGTGCTTFDGRALAVVRPTGLGDITVTAQADGCARATVRLRAIDFETPTTRSCPR
ncbi:MULTISPECIES: glycoside hydrolase family 2 TIM barrel-domain containing protein [Amycolatopsis]|uniref:Beta-galactosidase n=1 Tax=Amycolatopsis bullii TaxID=941987 RepID=A0ABQ3KFS3_9PSEU|nr:glycoside hydrolase family 2 TIM barrel-domain containing protein [Amycolatopsis bullii]GHG14539.1 beta-galactosidase [Amycolatopsis bullii]